MAQNFISEFEKKYFGKHIGIYKNSVICIESSFIHLIVSTESRVIWNKIEKIKANNENMFYIFKE